MAFCSSCGSRLTGSHCGSCGAVAQTRAAASPKQTKADPELTLLQKYADDIQRLGERLEDADPQSAKPLQKELERQISIYEKQLQKYKAQSPDPVDYSIWESGLYGFRALAKFNSVGFMRRAAVKHNSLAMAIVAKHQEKSNALEAIQLLDQAISIFDDGRSRFAKAGIYMSLKQTDNALVELNYILQHFKDGETYLMARQLKDEIENPPKKGMCFIATAVYGSPYAPQVILLREFRDRVLKKSAPGRGFIQLYYWLAPAVARCLEPIPHLRAVLKLYFFNPFVRLIKKTLVSKTD
jgi:tetratricopeptide (TPR) repeat protein